MNETLGRSHFFGIGAPRTASTWLYECLREHPEICMSIPKETGFFAKEKHYTGNRSDYINSFFKTCNRSNWLYGEIDPHYLYQEKAIRRICTLYPHSKLIVSLRNPVARAYSNFQKQKLKGITKARDFMEVIEKRIDAYIEPGYYAKHLERVFRIFPRQQVHIIFYEDIRNAPSKVISNLYEFLEVEASFLPKHIHHLVNVYGDWAPTSTSFNKIYYKLEDLAVKQPKHLKSALKKAGGLRLFRFLFDFNNSDKFRPKVNAKPQIRPEEREKLTTVYRDDILRLENMLQCDLSDWLRD